MNNINRDRGTKKWTALMLTEHTEKLREWYAEDQLIERPVFTEWDLQTIQEEIEIAYKSKRETLIKTWKDGQVLSYQGIIKELRVQQRLIILEDPFCEEYISVDEIISVNSCS